MGGADVDTSVVTLKEEKNVLIMKVSSKHTSSHIYGDVHGLNQTERLKSVISLY